MRGLSKNRIQGLDLLRGAAILLVILRHSWPESFGLAGIVGVVAFFTLSGYLITGVLMSDISKLGRVRYGHFYRNRAIRLIPALVFMLVGFVVVEGVLGVSGNSTRDIAIGVVVALLYVMNLPGIPHGSTNLSHLWTLANEEQFYLVWPFLLRMGVRRKRLGVVVISTGILIMLALVATIVVASPEVFKVYTLPTAWTIAMVLGAASRIWRDGLAKVVYGNRATILAAIAGAALLGIAILPEAKDSPWLYLVGGPAVGALTVLVIAKLRHVGIVPAAARPLVWLGTISYAAYLWNYPISWWLRDSDVPGWDWWTAVLTVVAATVSWFVVERPFNILKKRLDDRARTATPAASSLRA
nr:acyltransferase [Clavibacter michiganensis]